MWYSIPFSAVVTYYNNKSKCLKISKRKKKTRLITTGKLIVMVHFAYHTMSIACVSCAYNSNCYIFRLSENPTGVSDRPLKPTEVILTCETFCTTAMIFPRGQFDPRARNRGSLIALVTIMMMMKQNLSDLNDWSFEKKNMHEQIIKAEIINNVARARDETVNHLASE